MRGRARLSSSRLPVTGFAFADLMPNARDPYFRRPDVRADTMTFRTRYDLASGGPGIIFILLVILTVMLKPPFLYSMAILATGVIAGWLQSVQALTCPYCRNIAVAKDEEGEVPLPLVGAVPAQCCQCGASPDGIGG